MNNKEKSLIINFFKITEELRKEKIINSSRYLGDIAEYICEYIYLLKLCDNKRERGHDAVDCKTGKIKYQIKINNSTEKTNQDIGKKEHYDYLLLLITSSSKLYTSNPNYKIAIYKFSKEDLITEKYISKGFISQFKPELHLDENLNIIKQ
jgi:hypothetical protein